MWGRTKAKRHAGRLAQHWDGHCSAATWLHLRATAACVARQRHALAPAHKRGSSHRRRGRTAAARKLAPHCRISWLTPWPFLSAGDARYDDAREPGAGGGGKRAAVLAAGGRS